MPLHATLPEGYVPVKGAGAWGFARPEAVASAAEILGSGLTLHAWAAARPERREMAGRGRTWGVAAPGSAGARGWVVRHYHRGGIAARWLRDRYLHAGEPRPLAELRASLEAARRGIPTPAVVAGAVYAEGALFYRADLVTEEIREGVDLAGVLFGERPAPVSPLAAVAAAGALVRRLAEVGLRHPDVNAKNLVLEPHVEGVRAWLVDLDGCRSGRGPDARAGDAMRRRLERSLRKLADRHGTPMAADAWAALEAAFAPARAGR